MTEWSAIEALGQVVGKGNESALTKLYSVLEEAMAHGVRPTLYLLTEEAEVSEAAVLVLSMVAERGDVRIIPVLCAIAEKDEERLITMDDSMLCTCHRVWR